jgi:23S rRNA pseudouridine2605 synthase
MKERLHKVLAHAGVASRRRAEDLIREGLVTVGGEVVTEMGRLVDPETEEIRFEGEIVRQESPVYYLVNKPAGVLCTTEDAFGRKTILSLLNDRRRRRLYTVGRLDMAAEGIIIVTNDGDFANLISHPSSAVARTYYLKLTGSASDEVLAKVASGVWLPDGKSPPVHVHVLHRGRKLTTVLATVRQGTSQKLRRAFARIGHNVLKLSRVQIGRVRADGIKRGQVRLLKPAEIADLRAEAEARSREGRRGGIGKVTHASRREIRPWTRKRRPGSKPRGPADRRR